MGRLDTRSDSSPRDRVWARLLRLAAVGSLVWLHSPLVAQHYNFRVYGREEGIANQQIHSMCQDTTGYLWVGTRAGVYRYDGHRFEQFPTNQKHAYALDVQNVFCDAKGTVWASTVAGLSYWDGDEFVPVDFGKPVSMRPTDPIAAAADGSIYHGNSQGIWRATRKPGSGGWEFTQPAGELAARMTSAVEVDRQGRLWFGCLQAGPGGKRDLCTYTPQEGVRSVTTDVGVPEGRLWLVIQEDPIGGLWLRSQSETFWKPPGAAGFQPRSGPEMPGSGGGAVFDYGGRMLIPSTKGIAILPQLGLRDGGVDWTMVGESQGLPSNSVNSLFQDREGSVWLGLSGIGLTRWLGYGRWETWGRAEGLSNEAVWGPVFDASGTMYIATRGAIHRRVNQRIERFPDKPLSVGDNPVMATDPKGYLWVGSNERNGLWRIETGTGRHAGVPVEIRGRTPPIHGLLVDRERHLWVATPLGLMRSRRPGPDPDLAVESIYDSPVGFTQVIQDRKGRVWAANTAGIAIWENGRWHAFRGGETSKEGLRGGTFTLVEAPDGGVIAGYAEGGLGRLQWADGRLIVETPAAAEGARKWLAAFLGIDTKGRLWLGSDNGVHVWNGESWRSYSRSDGFSWNDTNYLSFAVSPGGEVWIGSSLGLNRYLESGDPRDRTPPEVALYDLSFQGKPVPLDGVPEIPYNESSLSVSFRALTFLNEREVRFLYRLIGRNNEWIETDQRQLLIQNLPAGRYQLEVKARSAAGVESIRPAKFSFVVARAWYQHPLTTLLFALGLFGLVRLFLFWRTRRLIQQQQRLEGLVLERTRDLEEARIRAEEANRLKSEFLANISHEIRTPMNGLLGMTELVLASELSAEQREHLESARSSGIVLLGLLNEILDLSKIEAGYLELEQVVFNVRQFMSETVRPFQLQAQRKGLECSVIVDPAVPQRLVGDPMRLRQVLNNLLGNAVKFTEQGFIRLEVTGISLAEESAQVQFSIQDSGIGIPADKRESVFEAFQQADNSMSRKYGGTGLGLAICRRLVARMGGDIELISEVGRGTIFRFCLTLGLPGPGVAEPPAAVPEDRIDNGQTQAVLTAAPAASTAPAAGLDILLAEDNPVNQKLAIRLLEKQGHQVTLAAEGRQAVDLALARQYDLILMDIQMPVMDGLEACREIRSREQAFGRYTPILAMTACAMVGDREQCLAAGMDDYLTKPFQPELLYSKVARWARRSQKEPAVP